MEKLTDAVSLEAKSVVRKCLPTVVWELVLLASISTLTLGLSQPVYGYPTSIDENVPAKWNHLHFSICVLNSADPEYEKLFVKAVEEWKNAWPHFTYGLQQGESCDISVNIIKHSAKTSAGHLGKTKITYYPISKQIEDADITIPTHLSKEVKQWDTTRIMKHPVPEKLFYIVSLHEFGHALGLGHAKGDGKAPMGAMNPQSVDGEETFDIMNPQAYEESEYIVSSLAVKVLDRIYGTSTDATDHPIKVVPSVKLEFETDKDNYVVGDTIQVSGKVSRIGKTGTVMLLDPSASLHTLTSFEPDDGGLFSVKIDLRTDYRGEWKTWVLMVHYAVSAKSILFDVEELPYLVRGQTDKIEYSLGDKVRISGDVAYRASRQVSIEVINPDGVHFAHKFVSISPEKEFDTIIELKKSNFTKSGEWIVRFGYEDTVSTLAFHVDENHSSV